MAAGRTRTVPAAGDDTEGLVYDRATQTLALAEPTGDPDRDRLLITMKTTTARDRPGRVKADHAQGPADDRRLMNEELASRLREEMVARLIARGVLRSERWIQAFGSVPRHELVPEVFTVADDGMTYPALL